MGDERESERGLRLFKWFLSFAKTQLERPDQTREMTRSRARCARDEPHGSPPASS